MSSKRQPPSLSDAEWEVMKPFWEHGPMAARDLFERLPEHHGWAYKTVKTMLARLVKKGALSYQQVGNSYLYRPAFKREAVTRRATRTFMERVFDGSVQPFAAHFLETVSREELQALKKEIDRIQRERSDNQ